MNVPPAPSSLLQVRTTPTNLSAASPLTRWSWIPMPMIDEEWRAFINEYNGVMEDVEASLYAALEGNRHALESLAERGEVPANEAQALLDTLRESLHRVQDRLNAFGRRIVRMREAYDLDEVRIATIGSHSALDICDGAVEEKFRTLVVCERGRDAPYTRYSKQTRAKDGRLVK